MLELTPNRCRCEGAWKPRVQVHLPPATQARSLRCLVAVGRSWTAVALRSRSLARQNQGDSL